MKNPTIRSPWIRTGGMTFLLVVLMACGGEEHSTGVGADAPTSVTTTTSEGMHEIRGADGSLRMRGPKVDGQRHGTWTSFFPNGMIRSRGGFQHGERHGSAEVYHENGMTYYTGQYHRGQPSGEWFFYGQDGELQTTVLYDTLGNILEKR